MKRESKPNGTASPSSASAGPVTPSLSGMSTHQRREFLERRAWEWIEAVEDVDRDISEDEVQLAYRLHFPLHLPLQDNCKKNCKYNPRCYVGLGEQRWLDSDDSEEEDEEDADIAFERRPPNYPAGLRNLGNTCYVNSFLQIWFHNVSFRQALYEWDPEQDAEEGDNETLLEAENYEPRGKVASLQALFAMLEFTNRRAVDPNHFIVKLGLDPQVQQDAQEFSKLFISLLESSLSNQNSTNVRSLVQSQFRGEYAYVTKCMACKRESARPSFFYELDLTLQGHKTLKDCLDDFTKKEKLQGDNQYFCENCNAKQDATRCVRISQVPTVLNLQLNRFIFDMQTGRKKKLNSAVQFPEQLDMSDYLRKPPGTQVYTLTGVLMHVGAEANHGHYLAHIQEACTGHWYKFSDALVERISGKNPKLGNECDPLMENGTKRSAKSSQGKSASKGTQSSNNAYMLVYTEQVALGEIRAKEQTKMAKKNLVKDRALREIRRKNKTYRRKLRLERRKKREARLKRMEEGDDEDLDDFEDEEDLFEDEEEETSSEEEMTSCSDEEHDEEFEAGLTDYTYVNGLVYPSNFPIYLRAYIEQDRRMLDEELEESILYRQERMHERISLRQSLRDICERMPYNEAEDTTGTDFEFIPTEWLMKYLESPQLATEEPIETLDYLCMHGRLDLDKICEVKVIDTDVADRLYEETGDSKGRRLTHDALCEICVKNHCRQTQLLESTARDAKKILDLLKEPISDSEPTYWVGKTTLKAWRKIAKENLTDDLQREADDYDDKMDFIEIMEIGLAASGTEKHAKAVTHEEGGENTASPSHEPLTNGLKVAKTEEQPKIRRASLSEDDEVSACSRQLRSSSSSNGLSLRNIDLEEVQSKLKKVGTNISVAHPKKAESPNANGGHSAVSVIPNGSTKADPEDAEHGSPPSTGINGHSEAVDSPKTSVRIKNGGDDSEEGEPPKPTVSAPPIMPQNLDRLHFNGDIICGHGQLAPGTASRKLVSEPIWLALKEHFPSATAFTRDHVTCPQCRATANEAARADEERRELAQAQKNALNDVLNERNRPSWSKASLNKVFLISRSFVQEWRSFIRNPSCRDPVTLLGNDVLLCEHAGLVYPLDLDTESDYESVIFMVSEDEWTQIQRFFEVDHAISVIRNKEGPDLLASDPKVCLECLSKRKEQEELEKLCYTNVPVYVRRLTGSDKTPVFPDCKDPDFGSPSVTPTSSNGATPNGVPPLKKAKLANGTPESSPVNGHHSPVSSSDNSVRRSHRRQKVRGEKEFIVSSSMLLRDFKIKIMESFKVAPFDQNLCANGVYLEDSSKTLAELKVLPKSLIYLRPDEPSHNGPIDLDDCWNMQHPEEGFKGTGLLGTL